MDKSKKLKQNVKKFKQNKNRKMKKEFNDRVKSKVDEHLNEDVELVILKQNDPGVLLCDVTYEQEDYGVYISYRYSDIVTHVATPKKEDDVFDIPHYLVVLTKESNKLVVDELAEKIVDLAKSQMTDDEVVRRFKTLKESVAVMGMFDGLSSLVGKEEV